MERKTDEKDTMALFLLGTNGEKYCDLFREYGITLNTLSFLTEDDLIILGVEEPEIRATILKHGQTKQPNCKDQYLPLKKSYVSTIFTETAKQILKLEKSILATYIKLKRSKTKIDPLVEENLYASQATMMGISCLEKNIDDLEKEIKKVETKIKCID